MRARLAPRSHERDDEGHFAGRIEIVEEDVGRPATHVELEPSGRGAPGLEKARLQPWKDLGRHAEDGIAGEGRCDPRLRSNLEGTDGGVGELDQ
jgi:hypothetical protein